MTPGLDLDVSLMLTGTIKMFAHINRLHDREIAVLRNGWFWTSVKFFSFLVGEGGREFSGPHSSRTSQTMCRREMCEVSIDFCKNVSCMLMMLPPCTVV